MTREEKYITLDTEQCKWWVNHLFNMAKEKACNSYNFDDAQEIQSAQDKIIKALEQEPCEDEIILTKEEYKQLLSSEFDNGYAKGYREALEQEPCEDCISRQALIERINNAEENFKVDNMDSISIDEENPFVDGVLSGVFNIQQMIAQAPPVTPTRKQEPIIDKIRAEIDQYLFQNEFGSEYRKEVSQIIDKYRESEE